MEIAGGDGEGAEHVAGAGGGEAAKEFEADDEGDGGLDFGAAGEVEVVEGEFVGAGEEAGIGGVLAAFPGVLALLLFVVGVVVDAEAGLFAG